MKIPTQFQIRTLLKVMLLAGCLLAVWESIPQSGAPILFGRIVDRNGVGIPDVTITLHPGIATSTPGQSTKTDGLGYFRFSPLETGIDIVPTNSRFPEKLVFIRVTDPAGPTPDHSRWWDAKIPCIKNFRYRWDYMMNPTYDENKPLN